MNIDLVISTKICSFHIDVTEPTAQLACKCGVIYRETVGEDIEKVFSQVFFFSHTEGTKTAREANQLSTAALSYH